MPHKNNAARRHHIGKMKFKATNWADYEAGLCQRGSLTLWMTEEALSSWQAPKRTTRGGQPRYSDLAIETALALGLVFGLRLRQTEGFLVSLLQLMGLDIAVPDHTTLSRRARTWRSSDRRQSHWVAADRPVHVLIDSTGLEVHGAGQWLEETRSTKSRRGWRKLHLAVDADSGEIIAQIMTDQDTGNASRMKPLLDHTWPDEMASKDRLRQAVPRRDRDWSIQVDHRPQITGSILQRTADGGRHRLFRPQSHVGMRAPEIRPPQGSYGIVTASKSKIPSRLDRCPKAMRKPKVEPDRMGDDLGWKRWRLYLTGEVFMHVRLSQRLLTMRCRDITGSFLSIKNGDSEAFQMRYRSALWVSEDRPSTFIYAPDFQLKGGGMKEAAPSIERTDF